MSHPTTAMLRTREIPTAPLVLYAVGIASIAAWLFDRSSRITTWADAAARTAPLEAGHRLAASRSR